MDKQYILSVDQSTSGSKVILFDEKGTIVESFSKEHTQYYPKPGWVEHNPNEIYENVVELLKKVKTISNLNLENIKALSITNQRETVVLWDKETGKPLHNAIVWQCRRSVDICNRYKKMGYENIIKEKTGLVLDPYFSASKVKWLCENVESVKIAAEKGTLAIGTIDSWLIWKLTAEKKYLTDHTNASRTMFYNIKELKWDKELLELFEIEESFLPEIKSSNDIFGCLNKDILGLELPISGVIGDSQGALFGQRCFERGTVKATYGTGSSVLMNIGYKYIESKDLCTSIGWVFSGTPTYVFEGVIVSSGDTMKWLKDNLVLFKDFDEVQKALNNKKENEGVYIVPAFVGLGIPYWKSDAKATIVGMTRATNKDNILRAGVESMAYQVMDAIETMEKESGINILNLNADGGATKNEILMQFQADMIEKNVNITNIAELSALGSAYLAGMAIGVWRDFEELKSLDNIGKVFLPTMEKIEIETNKNGWKKAVEQLLI